MLFLIGLVFLAVGLGMVWMAVASRRRAAAAAAWPSTHGTILDARLLIEETYDREDDDTTTTYRPGITYTYSVAGERYEGRRVDVRAAGLQSTDRRAAEATVARYSPGATVAVYYDPANPTDAVLEQAASGTSAFLVLGGGFALLGLILLLLG